MTKFSEYMKVYREIRSLGYRISKNCKTGKRHFCTPVRMEKTGFCMVKIIDFVTEYKGLNVYTSGVGKDKHEALRNALTNIKKITEEEKERLCKEYKQWSK